MQNKVALMTTNDIEQPLAKISDISASLGLLSRLPIPVNFAEAKARGAGAAWAFPIAGMLIALVVGCGARALLHFGVPAQVAAAIALGVQIVITGAMHEDGLADAADGLWGGWEKERRLEIMKDSRIGAYGVLALGLSLLIRWSALSAIFSAASVFAPLVAVAAVSRLPMLALMATLPNARGTGLSASVGQPSKDTLALGSVVTLVAAVVFAGWSFVPLFLFCAVATFVCARIALAKIGGQTGDILGATQQVVEMTALVTLASWAV